MEKIKRNIEQEIEYINTNSWWRNLNNSFKQYSTRVDELSKNAKEVKDKKKTGEILTNLKESKRHLQEDLSNLRGQLVTYCCTDKVKSNLSEFFSQQNKKSNISNDDLMYPMKKELFDALLNLLNKKPEELKNVPEGASEIKLSDWLNSTVKIWETNSEIQQKVTKPWQTIINNVIYKISQHNSANEILKAYMEKNSSACNRSLIESSQKYNLKYTELHEKRTKCFRTLRENDAKKTTLYYLQQLVSMKINAEYLENYKLALKNSPKKYHEFVYVWYNLQKLTDEIKIDSSNLITNYIPSPTNLQQNENVDLSNCIKKCLDDARQELTSNPGSFVVLWEEKYPNEKKKMWEKIYNECRNSCMKFYRPKSEDLKVLEDLEDDKVREKIYKDLKTYMILTMHHALCKFTEEKDQSLLNHGPQLLKRLYGGRKGLTLRAIPTKETAANKMRKSYLSYKKKLKSKSVTYKTLGGELLKTLNMSFNNSFPKTLEDELKTAKSDVQKRTKVLRWLRLERKTLEEEIKNNINAIDLTLQKARRTIDKCKNDLNSLTEETNKLAKKKKINVSDFLIWP